MVLIVAAFLLLSSCKGTAVGEPVVATRQVRDDLGRMVSIPARVTRAVSLAPDLTENIFAAGGGDRLVGVTTFCDYPEEAKAIAKVGDTMNPNIETIVALKPDIVFVSTASQIEAFMKTLEQNGVAVYVTNPKSLEDVFAVLQRFGDIFDTRVQADELVAGLRSRVEAIRPEGPLAKVFVQISREPLFTIGSESFLTAIIERAGGQSVTADVATAYPKLSKETALALDPEVIIMSDSEDNREPNEVFRKSRAVRNGRVYKIDPDLISRPGPRLVDALEQMVARFLQPLR